MKREPQAIRALDIQPEDPAQPDVISLIAASDEYLASLYPAQSNHSLDIASLGRPEVTFFVARLDGKAVGCGAISRRKKEYAEIKRMFVARNARGTGVGRRVLKTLEAAAFEQGYRVLRLETGISQPEAIGLYRSAGFVEVEPFGDYMADPLSIFFEKRLTDK
ncbi:MAG TPA: GNAT family N-acetyltransferase [Candidatus Binataceae bacterium]|nr:GNAT family N-acetyltransferase [Candidatus Binataceae bacterium]